jgi:uncharacterized protein (TIGR02246 family)
LRNSQIDARTPGEAVAAALGLRQDSAMSDDTVQVEDAFAIRRLCEQYAQAVDAGDSAEFVKVFTPDGHLVAHQGSGITHFNGRNELAQIPVQVKELAPVSMHFIGNHIAETNGESATGVTYCMAHHLQRDRSNLLMMVRYLDRYERRSGEWLIADRQVIVEWTETTQADPVISTLDSR